MFLKALRLFMSTVCCNSTWIQQIIVQALMAELHTMICETWKDTLDFQLIFVFTLSFYVHGRKLLVM